MARELRRLLIDPERLAACAPAGGRLALLPAELHYLNRVLRLRPGESVAVVDGCGSLWIARLGEGPWLEQWLTQPGQPDPPRPQLCLALALPRQEVELVWRMATELGIDRLQPLWAGRCQESGRRERPDRWSAVLREASEQCERLWLPQLDPAQEAIDWLSQPARGMGLLATTRREHLASLENALEDISAAGSPPDSVSLAIGPEGGWTPAEEEQAEASGWIPISLGDSILRSSTAAVAGVSRLAAWRQLSCASCRGPSP